MYRKLRKITIVLLLMASSSAANSANYPTPPGGWDWNLTRGIYYIAQVVSTSAGGSSEYTWRKSAGTYLQTTTFVNATDHACNLQGVPLTLTNRTNTIGYPN